jgi:hypothetical protein
VKSTAKDEMIHESILHVRSSKKEIPMRTSTISSERAVITTDDDDSNLFES